MIGRQGEGDRADEVGRIWRGDHSSITVVFVDGKVDRKSWDD